MLIAAAMSAGTSHAARISLDSDFGVGTITRDTTTKLDWLDLWVTRFATTDDLIALKDGPLSGFRYATGLEVWNLVSPYLIPFPDGRCTVPTPYCPMQIAGVMELANLVYLPASQAVTNPTELLDRAPLASGLFGPSGSLDLANQAEGDIGSFALYIGWQTDLSGGRVYSAEFDVQSVNFPVRGYWDHGYFLVRPIPEPPAVWLVGSGFALVAISRKRKAVS
jgi:hypothetical protein